MAFDNAPPMSDADSEENEVEADDLLLWGEIFKQDTHGKKPKSKRRHTFDVGQTVLPVAGSERPLLEPGGLDVLSDKMLVDVLVEAEDAVELPGRSQSLGDLIGHSFGGGASGSTSDPELNAPVAPPVIIPPPPTVIPPADSVPLPPVVIPPPDDEASDIQPPTGAPSEMSPSEGPRRRKTLTLERRKTQTLVVPMLMQRVESSISCVGEERIQKLEGELEQLHEEPNNEMNFGWLKSQASGMVRTLRRTATRGEQETERMMSPEPDDPTAPTLEIAPIGPHWIQKPAANVVFGGAIVLNAVFLGIEADYNKDNQLGWFICESVFLLVFSFELCLRLRADRYRCMSDKWNMFDFSLVFLGILDTWVLTLLEQTGDMQMLTVLRVVRLAKLARVFRIVRLFRFLRELVILAQGIHGALKALIWAMLLILIVLYIFAVLVTNTIGRGAEEGDQVKDWFGTVGKSLFTLFQLMTLEDWAFIVRKVMRQSVWTWLFFIPFIMFTSYILLNLVTAVVVERIISVAQAEASSEANREDKERKKTIKRICKLFRDIDLSGTGVVCVEDFRTALRFPIVLKKFIQLGMTKQDAEDFFDCFQEGGKTLTIAEFVDGCLRIQGPAKAKHLLQVQYDLARNRRSVNKRIDAIQTQVNIIGLKVEDGLLDLGCKLDMLIEIVPDLGIVSSKPPSEAPAPQKDPSNEWLSDEMLSEVGLGSDLATK